MSLRYGILGLLRYRPQSGYDLVKTFNDSLQFFWQATSSQVYRELNSLEEQAWVKSERVSNEKRPDRRVYHLQPSGAKAFQEWIEGFANLKPDPARLSFVMRLFFSAALSPGEQQAFLEKHRQDALRNLGELEGAEALVELYAQQLQIPEEAQAWKLSISFGKHMARAHLDWVQQQFATPIPNETQAGDKS